MGGSPRSYTWTGHWLHGLECLDWISGRYLATLLGFIQSASQPRLLDEKATSSTTKRAAPLVILLLLPEAEMQCAAGVAFFSSVVQADRGRYLPTLRYEPELGRGCRC